MTGVTLALDAATIQHIHVVDVLLLRGERVALVDAIYCDPLDAEGYCDLIRDIFDGLCESGEAWTRESAEAFAEVARTAACSNRFLRAIAFMNQLAGKVRGMYDIPTTMRRWMCRPKGEMIFLDISSWMPPEETWSFAAQDDSWKMFALLALRIVAAAPSEAEVERVMSRQREIVGGHARRMGHDILRARTVARCTFE
jgi:hypothetical protein